MSVQTGRWFVGYRDGRCESEQSESSDPEVGEPKEHPLTKRLLDISLGLVLCVLVTPLIIALALASAVALGAWPIFAQWRVGRGSRPFRMYKIRTLPRTAPRYADKYGISEIPVSRFCSFLRNSHLDELPQLWLVPLGRMSLVGPRPEMPALHARFDATFAELRTSVRPGCTGLWQVSARAHRLIREAPEFDRVYVEQATAMLDLWILWRTLCNVVRPSDATLDDVPPWALRIPPADVATAPFVPDVDGELILEA